LHKSSARAVKNILDLKEMRPKPPSNLSRGAKKIWVSIADELDELDGSALLLLNMLAETWDTRQAARAEIAKSADGPIFLDRFNQPKVSPHALVEANCTLAIIRLYRTRWLDLAPEGGK
jgi:phage terminase small subunit